MCHGWCVSLFFFKLQERVINDKRGIFWSFVNKAWWVGQKRTILARRKYWTAPMTFFWSGEFPHQTSKWLKWDSFFNHLEVKLLKLMFIYQEKEFTCKFIDSIKTNGFLFNRLVKIYKNYIVSPNSASVKFASLETKFASIAKESNLIRFA